MDKPKWLYLISGLLLSAMLLAPAIFSKQDSLKPKPLTGKPQRIVSMSPGNTEIVFALGAGDRVVGVTSYSDYPEEAKSKPTIGGYHAPDVEKIVALSPDIVFAMTDIQAKYIQILKQAGIRVIAVEPKSLPEILTAIDIISEAIGEQERGNKLHRELADQLAEVRRLVGSAPLKRTFLEVWDTPLLTVGRQSFIHDLISQAGGINVSADKNVDYTPCDTEQLYAYNPEVYVVLSHSRDDVRSLITNPNLGDIQAVKNNQVFSITDDLLQRPGPRSFTGLVKLAEILHPQEMKDWENK
ncbi:cobalamin-binding protein [Anaerospora sp.]|jgi:iron complex transport system substrate-binding protein|uniref:ABC transporter substrate-binding protein n=1 Tax=Anaerospora sp. TaxID=1960278 RepID=UPI00289A4936|nr:cobalamin-binding protein [Anaerospora sp.]